MTEAAGIEIGVADAGMEMEPVTKSLATSIKVSMTKLQIVLGPIPESVITVAFEQHPPDMVLVHEAELTALDDFRALDVIEDRSEFVRDGCEALNVTKEGREMVCDGCESV